MNNTVKKIQTEKAAPALVKKIGNTTYIVNIHFKESAKETLQQKIERMLKDEVKYSA